MSKVFSPNIRAQIIHQPHPDEAVVLVMVGTTPIGTYVAVGIEGVAPAEVVEAVIGGLLTGEITLDPLAEPEPEPEPETPAGPELEEEAGAAVALEEEDEDEA